MPWLHTVHAVVYKVCILALRLSCVCCRAVMNDIGTAPLQVVGYEGIFGCLAMFCVLLPIVQHTPGQDGTGLHEDTWETWHVSPVFHLMYCCTLV